MKKSIALLLFLAAGSRGITQQYLYDRLMAEATKKLTDSTVNLSVEYWYYDTCLFSNGICRNTTSTAFRQQVLHYDSAIECRYFQSSQKWYKNAWADNEYRYVYMEKESVFFLLRTLYIEYKEADKWLSKPVKDTFFFTVADTLYYSNHRLFARLFGNVTADSIHRLPIFVLRCRDRFGSLQTHYWLDRVGIIKVTDEKCWRYSFELRNDLDKRIAALTNNVLLTIKKKYPDPYWEGAPCGIENENNPPSIPKNP